MKVVIFFLFGLICTLSGCVAPSVETGTPVAGLPAATYESLDLWESCDTTQAEAYRDAADQDANAALRGAACYAYLVERANGDLTAAENGRKLAEKAVVAFPQSAEAHYLLGYLAGLVAQRNSLRALSLVPVIEREALAAFDLDPSLDQAGPARMLGDLYLRAPEFPVSIGDPSLAVDYFRQAVELAPDQADNRLGLIEALLTEDQTADACRQLQTLWQTLAPEEDPGSVWQRGLDLQLRMCEGLEQN
ncbi:MAG: tetratricopeptide repeat protein [Pedobacter sp.]